MEASTFGAGLVGAVISASVAVVVALWTQWRIGARDRRARRDERARADLVTVQDAAAALRRRLRAYDRALGRAVVDAGLDSPGLLPGAGTEVELTVPEDVQGGLDEALELFDVHVVRVGADVQAAAWTWRGRAQFRFAQGIDDVSVAAEQEAWAALHQEVRRALPG